MFTITKGEAKQQSVKINRVESLGNNNYYKVTGSVSGAKSCKGGRRGAKESPGYGTGLLC